MSLGFAFCSLTSATTIMKSRRLFGEGAPYKAVNWMIMGMFAQMLGAVFFGTLPVAFLACAYVAFLFYLHKAWQPSLTLKDNSVSAPAQPAKPPMATDRFWYFPSLSIALIGAMFAVLPNHTLSVIGPWLSVFALVSGKFMALSRSIKPRFYLILTMPAIAPLVGPIGSAYIPGLLVMEGFLMYHAWLLMRAAPEAEVAEGTKVDAGNPEHEPKADESRPEPVVNEPAPVDYEVVIHKGRPSEPTAGLPPIKPDFSDFSRFSEPEPEAPVDDFFPDPKDVPKTIELPQPIFIRLGQAVKSLFSGTPKQPTIRREPTINE